MYLKSLTITGFKSFADKTALEFKPGMTAIVGPNGCGKSNVSDAIRWVLGEQSARMLRGSKMEDCIFSGTDSRKPLGMAEVSITFTDCEGRLETEYHEVTISRRVFRSGEGQYFINKTPCRLKDIQRLFLGTGVGTSSYSFMQQGRIDQVLSSRPEDRRTIFEEASGITKYKADKKEAIRKLEQTEANLLRLSDVIREVRRQIGSLQRQASKAQKYKVLYDELRELDIQVSRERLTSLTTELQELASQTGSLTAAFDNASAELEALTTGSATLRERFNATEEAVVTQTERANDIRNGISKGEELLRVNTQRVRDYQDLAKRTQQEIIELAAQLEEARTRLTSADQELADTTTLHGEISDLLAKSSATLKEHLASLDAQRNALRRAQSQLLESDNTASRLQNALADLDLRQRATLVKKERLAAEKSQLSRLLQSMEEREQSMKGELSDKQLSVDQSKASLTQLETQRSATTSEIDSVRATISTLQADMSGRNATRTLLEKTQKSGNAFTSGARFLLDNKSGDPSSAILGTLASFLDVDPPFRTALETALRPWVDALVVSNPSAARDSMLILHKGQHGSVRLLPLAADSAEAIPVCTIPNATPLWEHVRCADSLKNALHHVLGRIVVVPSIQELPVTISPDFTVVTQDGALLTRDGWSEFWMADQAHASPLSTKLALDEAERDLAALSERLSVEQARSKELQEQLVVLDANIRIARQSVADSSQKLSQQEGQLQIVSKEAKEARGRVETVTWELDDLLSSDQAGVEERRTLQTELEQVQAQRQSLSEQIREANDQLHRHEDKSATLHTQAADHGARFAASEQKLSSLRYQRNSQATRIGELEASIAKRREDVTSHESACQRLETDMEALKIRMVAEQTALITCQEELTALRRHRDQQRDELQAMESSMGGCRGKRDDIRDKKAKVDIRNTELRFKHQTYTDRMSSAYGLTLSDVLNHASPALPEGEEPMSLESKETRLEELRTKIDAMGPVNLVAIEEHKELEQREQFLSTQEQDLNQAKTQLMEMIRKINRTTSEMFKETFDQVNIHFQAMFEKLFGGGSARLVLVDEEDVLECGIEIIARPPGKKLQNISLMSGGERTLTAVALLFAIYLIKPSPFCLLDELDAPLDESNIGRFVTLLKDFLKMSQFVVITHNRKTISAADILYGVTMQEKGVSNIVSMRFQERLPDTSQPATPEPDPVTPSPEPEVAAVS